MTVRRRVFYRNKEERPFASTRTANWKPLNGTVKALRKKRA